MKNKVKLIIITIIILIITGIILFLTLNKSNKSKIIGSWTTDGITIYKFNKDNTGSLIVSLKEYNFIYKIDDKNLEIDFENKNSIDSKYTYYFEDNKLILNGDNGIFTFIKK